MTAGKNKLLRWARCYFGGYDLSGDTRTIGSLENSMGSVPNFGLDDTVEVVLPDFARQMGIKGYQALLNDAAGRSAGRLSGGSHSHVVSMFLGGGAAPAAGDLAYLLPGLQMGDPTEFGAAIGVIAADFMVDASQLTANILQPFGKVLEPLTAESATGNGAAVDFGAASALGGFANLHVFVSSGGTWAFKVQHSTDASSWADLITFTITGNSVISQQKDVAGAINRYARLVKTRTSGTCTIACALARN